MFKKKIDLSSIILTVFVLGATAFTQNRILYTALRPPWSLTLTLFGSVLILCCSLAAHPPLC
jgi:hypothetical protein